MQNRYIQLTHKVRLFLQKEIRKNSWLGKCACAVKVFEPCYWSWDRESVAVGAGWGAMAAISPLPMQCLWAILSCIWRKGNIPIAVLMAWLSPPGFTFFSVPAQWWLGNAILFYLGLPISEADWEMVKAAVDSMSLAPFHNMSLGMCVVELLIGWVVSSIVLGILVYWLVQAVWGVKVLISGFTHKRNKTLPPSGK